MPERRRREPGAKIFPENCPGFSGITVRELLELLSRYYWNRCPGITGTCIEEQAGLQFELPLGLVDEKHRPGTRKGQARWSADRAMDAIRERFGWEAVGYASVALGRAGSVPDAFRELAEKEL